MTRRFTTPLFAILALAGCSELLSLGNYEAPGGAGGIGGVSQTAATPGSGGASTASVGSTTGQGGMTAVTSGSGGGNGGMGGAPVKTTFQCLPSLHCVTPEKCCYVHDSELATCDVTCSTSGEYSCRVNADCASNQCCGKFNASAKKLLFTWCSVASCDDDGPPKPAGSTVFMCDGGSDCTEDRCAIAPGSPSSYRFCQPASPAGSTGTSMN